MKRLLMLFLILVAKNVYADATLSGEINSDLTVGGNVSITDSIIVKDGVTLTFEAGTVVKLDSESEISVKGTIVALGTVTDSIKFIRSDEIKPWAGFTFYKTLSTNDSSMFEYCVVEGAKKYQGGAFAVYDFDKLRITHSRISGNTSITHGGGFYLSESSPMLLDCEISGNLSTSSSKCHGGGLYLRESNPTILDCEIRGNTAFYGGGLYLSTSTDVAVSKPNINFGTKFYNNLPNNGDLEKVISIVKDTTISGVFEHCGFTVANGATLTISTGTIVKGFGRAKIIIDGAINASGTINDSIVFTSADKSKPWVGFTFDSTLSTNDSSIFDYCVVKGAKKNEGGVFYVQILIN